MTGIEITGEGKDEESLEPAEQEAIGFAEMVADAAEEAAQPEPLNVRAETPP
jgi:hypothetical protein